MKLVTGGHYEPEDRMYYNTVTRQRGAVRRLEDGELHFIQVSDGGSDGH